MIRGNGHKVTQKGNHLFGSVSILLHSGTELLLHTASGEACQDVLLKKLPGLEERLTLALDDLKEGVIQTKDTCWEALGVGQTE